MAGKPDLRPLRTDLKLERASLGPGAGKKDFRYEKLISGLRGQISAL